MPISKPINRLMPNPHCIMRRRNFQDMATTNYNLLHKRTTDAKYMPQALWGYADAVFTPSVSKNCRVTSFRRYMQLLETRFASVGIGSTSRLPSAVPTLLFMSVDIESADEPTLTITANGYIVSVQDTLTRFSTYTNDFWHQQKANFLQ